MDLGGLGDDMHGKAETALKTNLLEAESMPIDHRTPSVEPGCLPKCLTKPRLFHYTALLFSDILEQETEAAQAAGTKKA